ncbi:MAG: phosphopantetheine-binding protein [Gemmatimonadota bacterium]|nr:phosphopantetheine-binding protein [Gemmatimonadota bacterium]
MSDYQEVLARVKKVTMQILNVDESEITEKSEFAWDLGAESIDSIKLVAGFDEEFDIEMDEAGAVQVQSVSAAVEFIMKYLD